MQEKVEPVILIHPVYLDKCLGSRGKVSIEAKEKAPWLSKVHIIRVDGICLADGS